MPKLQFMEFDWEHIVVVLGAILGATAALVTIYPPDGKWRRLWAAVFILLGLIASIVGWLAVNSSQRQATKQITALTGGDNYPYVQAVGPNSDPFSPLWLLLWNRGETPLFDVDVEIWRAPDSGNGAETKIFGGSVPILKPGYLVLSPKIQDGLYQVEMSARNGTFREKITIKKTDGGLSNVTLVYKLPDVPPGTPINGGMFKLLHSEPPIDPNGGFPIFEMPLPRN